MKNFDIIKNKINRAGKLSKNRLEHFNFYSLAGKDSSRHLLVKIQNLSNKSLKISRYYDLVKSFKNPFNLSQERHEERIVQPKIKKVLRKFNFIIEQEVRISSRSRVDFVCTNKSGKKILIEVKSDKKRHSSIQLSDQLSKYRQDAKLKYGNKYVKTYLVSLKGRYGYSLKELEILLKREFSL